MNLPCNCGVAAGLRTDHEAECQATYQQRTPRLPDDMFWASAPPGFAEWWADVGDGYGPDQYTEREAAARAWEAASRKAGHAVLTGSQVYGLPRPDSDVDLVVLADPDTQRLVATLLTGDPAPEVNSGPRGGISVKAGRLNLIFTSRPEELEAWRQGTRDLVGRAPVSRGEAVDYLRVVVGDGNP